MSEETNQSSGAAAAPAAAPPTAGDGGSVPTAYLKLSFRPEQRGKEKPKGVTLTADQVLSWRDRGDVVAVVTTAPVEGPGGWREQKLFAAKPRARA